MKTFLSIISLFTLVSVGAQTPKNSRQKNPAAVVTKPVFKTSLGNLSDTATIYVEELMQLLAVPLKVSDDKKNTYPIISYRLLYTKQGVTENEEMTKALPTSSKVSGYFTSTPLPGIWIDNIRQGLKPAEELFFFDIAVRDTKGKLWFVPNLKIKTR